MKGLTDQEEVDLRMWAIHNSDGFLWAVLNSELSLRNAIIKLAEDRKRLMDEEISRRMGEEAE